MARMAVVLVIVAFFLKAAIVPFHAWAPDAYETAAVPVTAYMAVLVKAGVLLAAVRLFGTANVTAPLAGLLALLPLISIVWGNLAAMRQQSFRRMIAYSSIAHAGYLFYAFLGDAPGRFQAVAFYVIAYGAMNLLAFAALPPDERRRGARSARQPEGPVPPPALCRGDDRRRDAVAGGHSAVARVRREIPDLQERDRRRIHGLRRAGPRRQLPRHLLLSARDPVPVHERRSARREDGHRRTPGDRRRAPVPRCSRSRSPCFPAG